ncbi:MAG: PQQ-binding-like beta-propeller repeat protein, partial [Dokdonella sp.]
MNVLRIHSVLITLLAALAPHATSAGNPSPLWQVEYTSSGTPPIPISGQPKLAVGPAGIYAHGFAEPGALGSVVVKLDPLTANSEWSVIAPLETEFGAAKDGVVVLENGPLVLAGSISRLSDVGDVEWSIPRSPNYFYGYGTAAAAVSNVGLLQLAHTAKLSGGGSEFKISLLSPSLGETFDSLALPFSGSDDDCRLIDLVNANMLSSYVASNCVDGMLLKLNLFPLSVQWTLPPSTPAIDYLTSMRADASGVYITGSRNGSSFLSKLATSDASTLWNIDRPAGSIETVRIDIDGNPVVSGNSIDGLGSIEKLDAATGASQWTHVSDGTINALFVGANALVVAGADRLSPAEFDTRGFVERLDPVTGASQWRSVLTSPDGGSSNATSVVQQGDRIVVAGTACALPVDESSKCTVAFWRSAASSSAAAESAQSPAQVRVATSGIGRVGNDDSVYVAVTERSDSNAQLRVTRQRKSDGVQVWQAILPIDVDADSWRGVDRYEFRLGGDGNPLILLASDPADFIGASDARVIKLDAANGTTLWSRDLIDSATGQTDAAVAGIASDTTGNVFVPAHERYVDLIVTPEIFGDERGMFVET